MKFLVEVGFTGFIVVDTTSMEVLEVLSAAVRVDRKYTDGGYTNYLLPGPVIISTVPDNAVIDKLEPAVAAYPDEHSDAKIQL